MSGSTVYAGGSFQSIGGQARNRIAALDAATGSATAWNPNAQGFGSFVRALAVSGGTVYVAGEFTSIGGQLRNNIAALDAASGAATAWNPNVGPSVRALAVNGSTVYVGGSFQSIGGQARNRIAALDAATGSVTAWNPNADNQVFALAVSGPTVYAGGAFSSIGGTTRNRIAALDATSGNAAPWNPNANNDVFVLATDGSTVYVGGQFTTILNQPQQGLAALSDATVGVSGSQPSEGFDLEPPFPNPTAGSTTLQLHLPRRANITATVRDLQGRIIRRLIRNATQFEAGLHPVVWDGRDERGKRVLGGIYFLNVIAGGRALGRKIVVMR